MAVATSHSKTGYVKGEYSLMTTNGNGADAQRHRVHLCEPFGRLKAPGNEITILFHVDGQSIRRWIVRTQLCLAYNDDNISPLSIAIQIESHSRVSLDVRLAFRVGPTIDENGRCSLIPPEPYWRGLWRPLRINGRQPDYMLVPQSASHPLTKWCRRVGKLKCHVVSSTFSKMIYLRHTASIHLYE